MRVPTRPLSMPPAVAAVQVTDRPLRANAELRTYATGDGRLGDLVEDQIVIDFDGVGPFSQRSFVARTRAAAELLSTPAGKSLERMLRGALSTLDGSEAVSELRGVALPKSFAGDAALRAVTLAEDGILPAMTSPELVDILPAWIASAMIGTAEAPGMVAGTQQTFSRIHFNPAYTDGLLQLAVTPRAETVRIWGKNLPGKAVRAEFSDVIGHELHHSITPVDIRADEIPGYWLEEATAGALSTWAGAPEALAAAMRFDDLEFAHPIEPTGYPGPIKAMRRLLALAGIDSLNRQSRAEATKLLQGRPLDAVPAALANAIAEHKDLPETSRADLADRIQGLVDWKAERGDALLDPPEIPSRMAEIERLVGTGHSVGPEPA